MQHSEHPNIESSFFKSLTSPGSAFAITFLFLVFQYTFRLDFQCPCDPSFNIVFGLLYMLFPALILFCILTLTAKTTTTICLGIWKHNCKNGCCKYECCCCSTRSGRYIYKHIIKNIFLSSLWIIMVCIDGDVIACLCLTEVNVASWHDQIPCKEKQNFTIEDCTTIKQCQTESQIAGLVLLLGIPAIWLFIYIVCQCCSENPYNLLYKDLYENEAITLVEMGLQEMAKRKAEENYQEIITDIENLISEQVKNLLDETIPAYQLLEEPQDTPQHPQPQQHTLIRTSSTTLGPSSVDARGFNSVNSNLNMHCMTTYNSKNVTI